MMVTLRPIIQKRHTFQVASLAWSPDGAWLASAGAQQASVCEACSGKIRYAYRSHTLAVVAVAWSPDGSRLACSGNGGAIEVWEQPQRQPGHTIAVFRGHTSHVLALA